MKKTQYTLLLAFSVFAYVLTGCKSPTPAVPVSDQIKNAYVAQSVLEGSTTAYTAGGTSNTKPGYSQFRLNLSNPPAVTLTTLDGAVFTGTYALVGDSQIVLSGLTPAPTGGNTITYNITNLADGTVTLTRTSPDPKTGNTLNVYNLKKG